MACPRTIAHYRDCIKAYRDWLADLAPDHPDYAEVLYAATTLEARLIELTGS